MTQEQLARVLGLSRPSVVNIERGRQPVQVHVLVDIAGAIGVRAMDLLPETTATPRLEFVGNQAVQRLSRDKQNWVASVIRDADTGRPQKGLKK